MCDDVTQEICIINHTQKLQQRQSGPEAFSQQTLQQVRVLRAHRCHVIFRPLIYTPCLSQEEEEEEEQRISRVSQERQRTLDRLRTFKQV